MGCTDDGPDISGVQTVVAVIRCHEWADARLLNTQLELAEHIEVGNDSGLRFHTSRGAEVRAIVHGWHIEDAQNEGCGIIIEYCLSHFHGVNTGYNMRHEGSSSEENPTCVRTESDELALPESNGPPLLAPSTSSICSVLISEAIGLARALTNSTKADADSALMEAGLDSLLMTKFTEVCDTQVPRLVRDSRWTRFGCAPLAAM